MPEPVPRQEELLDRLSTSLQKTWMSRQKANACAPEYDRPGTGVLKYRAHLLHRDGTEFHRAAAGIVRQLELNSIIHLECGSGGRSPKSLKRQARAIFNKRYPTPKHIQPLVRKWLEVLKKRENAG